MYMGDLSALGQVGERFMLYAEKGRSVSCPAGTTEESSGRMGTGQKYVNCYRPPVFAPPPTTTVTYHAPITSVAVPTAISTQVSPQISPAMAQQQASPGATATGAPVQSMPGGVSAQPSTGITGEDLRRILEAQALADDAEREARERKDAIEIENLRREMAERTRTMDEIEAARRADEARRVDAERYAREQAEATAKESAGAIPPPPSMTYAPSGGGMLPAMAPPSLPDAFAPSTVDVTQAPVEAGTPWALILMAAAGIGVVVLAGGKGKRKKRVKK
jgi:hypothetical protein